MFCFFSFMLVITESLHLANPLRHFYLSLEGIVHLR